MTCLRCDFDFEYFECKCKKAKTMASINILKQALKKIALLSFYLNDSFHAEEIRDLANKALDEIEITSKD